MEKWKIVSKKEKNNSKIPLFDYHNFPMIKRSSSISLLSDEATHKE
jgi:hypothetical protein